LKISEDGAGTRSGEKIRGIGVDLGPPPNTTLTSDFFVLIYYEKFPAHLMSVSQFEAKSPETWHIAAQHPGSHF